MMKNKILKIQELFDFDNKLSNGSDIVIGTDEAGRGPGAGPVFAAAVCFSDCDDENLFEKLQILNDSKQLTEHKREELFETITELEKTGKCHFSIQQGSVKQIAKTNILNTSLGCMKKACEEIIEKSNKSKIKVLVDGNRQIKNFSYPQITVVKGDSKSAAIAAASILAKVSRDRFMEQISKEFPEYHWEKNKGYLSKEHIEAIKKFGPTVWHREKFLRNILQLPEKNKTQLSLF